MASRRRSACNGSTPLSSEVGSSGSQPEEVRSRKSPRTFGVSSPKVCASRKQDRIGRGELLGPPPRPLNWWPPVVGSPDSGPEQAATMRASDLLRQVVPSKTLDPARLLYRCDHPGPLGPAGPTGTPGSTPSSGWAGAVAAPSAANEGPHHPRLRGAGEAGVMGAAQSVTGASRASGDGPFTGGRKER